jgi:hypothetical protein
MNDRARGHHLGEEQGFARQQAVEKAAVPIRPIDHGGNGKAPGLRDAAFSRFCWGIGHFIGCSNATIPACC